MSVKVIQENGLIMERDEKREYLVQLREKTGMTRKDFAIEYDIPYPTITDWELGQRRVPEYLLRLLAYKIGFEELSEGCDSRNSSQSRSQHIIMASDIDTDNISDELINKVLFEGIYEQ